MAAEKSFEKRLKKWLVSEGIYALGTPEQGIITPPCGYWEKRWGGGKYTKSGLPDMHIVVNNINFDFELKAPNGRPSELQIQKINQISDANCIGVVLYPKDFEKFKAVVKFVKSNLASDLNRICYEMIVSAGLERGWKK